MKILLLCLQILFRLTVLIIINYCHISGIFSYQFSSSHFFLFIASVIRKKRKTKCENTSKSSSSLLYIDKFKYCVTIFCSGSDLRNSLLSKTMFSRQNLAKMRCTNSFFLSLSHDKSQPCSCRDLIRHYQY